MSDDSDSDYTFIYPHPDHLVWGSVTLSQDAISKRNIGYLIEEAAKRYPAISINPTPTVYKVCTLSFSFISCTRIVDDPIASHLDYAASPGRHFSNVLGSGSRSIRRTTRKMF